MQVTKIKLRNLFQQKMIETQQCSNEYDKDYIARLLNQVESMETENTSLLNTIKQKNEQINSSKAKLIELSQIKTKYDEACLANDIHTATICN